MAKSFGEILGERTIFNDKSVLSPHFTPSSLIHRDPEIEEIMRCLAPLLRDFPAKNLFVYGKPGTGKTSCVAFAVRELYRQEKPNVFSAYLNCRTYNSRYKAVQKIVSSFDPAVSKTGLSLPLLSERLLDWLEGDDSSAEKGKRLVVVLDEVDMVKDVSDLIYTLTRSNDDLQRGGISIMGISNKVDFKKALDSRTRSSLCETELVFHAYNAIQLQAIVSSRCDSAFKKNAVSEDAVNSASAIAASENGDARYALNLILRAGELAEKSGLERVTFREVELARKAADEDKAFELIDGLPEHQKLVLLSMASIGERDAYPRLVAGGDEDLLLSGDVYGLYCSIAKANELKPVSTRWFRQYLNELESIGLIATVRSGKGVRGQARLLKLGFDAKKIRSVVEKAGVKDSQD